MLISPQEAVAKTIDATQNLDWARLADFERGIKRYYADHHDWAGLVSFYSEVLRLGVTPAQLEKMVVKDIEPFILGVTDVVARGLAIAARRPEIKAVYFEYHLGGREDSCTGDIFLCKRYDPDDDDWASDFGADGYLEGPRIFEYMGFDLEHDFEPITRAISSAYVDACLLAAFGRVVDQQTGNKLPFGFATHDAPIVKIMPKG